MHCRDREIGLTPSTLPKCARSGVQGVLLLGANGPENIRRPHHQAHDSGLWCRRLRAALDPLELFRGGRAEEESSTLSGMTPFRPARSPPARNMGCRSSAGKGRCFVATSTGHPPSSVSHLSMSLFPCLVVPGVGPAPTRKIESGCPTLPSPYLNTRTQFLAEGKSRLLFRYEGQIRGVCDPAGE